MRYESLQGVIFDWAGTVVDFGSLAPTQIFVDVFRRFGITITRTQANGPMGLSKRCHIEALLADPAIAAQWRLRAGRDAGQSDIDEIYARFIPMQVAKVNEYSQPIPGAIKTLGILRARGLKLGSCSGYPREVMDVLIPMAWEAGLKFDHVVAGDDLEAGGRPGAYMALANMVALQLPSVHRCVKVDDTTPGIEEGRNAGMWSVGVALSGACAGLALDEYQTASPKDLALIRKQATNHLIGAGAHYVVDSVADLLAVVDAIDERVGGGDYP